MNTGNILVIDDDNATRETLEIVLREEQFQVETAANGYEGIDILKSRKVDLVITDLRMDGLDGIEVLETIREADGNLPVIIITAYEDMTTIIEAMRLGAYDYIEKPIDIARLKLVISRALRVNTLATDLEVPNGEDSGEEGPARVIVGRSPGIRGVMKKIGQVSSSKVNVLIQGESGTGKELVSRVIHSSSVTAEFPFVPVDLSALPETLMESELFGHEKGAFTGALKGRRGRFELAGEGTIFLDEISEIPLNQQVKLLRVLQEREFVRVGSGISVPMKARIIAATNKDLEELVRQGKFREDLFYRISVFTIYIPPLRERKEDIPALVVHLLKKINKDLHKNIRKIPREVVEILQSRDWEGNVRELENVLMQAAVLAKGEVLEKENLIFREDGNHQFRPRPQSLSLALLEKAHIRFVLEKTKGDKKEAARLLEISRQTLYNKIKRYNLM